jgi:hypothetical protein
MSENLKTAMQIPDEIRKCVVFVGFQMADQSFRMAGTAFFLSRSVPGVPDRVFCYLMTAKHVITKIRDLGLDTVCIRVNLKNGNAQWISTALDSWYFHETDPCVDVAVSKFEPADELDHLVFSLMGAATEFTLSTLKIGIGVEIFIVGLFSQHFGKSRNIPIVRIGNIAAMADEKVSTKLGDIDAYLIEARSTGGISGAPVFFDAGDKALRYLRTFPQKYFLLGIVHGHFDVPQSTRDALEDSLSDEKINMGIGIVVPTEIAIEVMNHSGILKQEAQEAMELMQKRDNIAASPPLQ